jgi:hypothetical protein
MNNFHEDHAWQKNIRDSILAPHFYGKYSVGGRYVFIDKGALATQLQRDFAVDTIAQGKDGHAVCIEEKIVRWKGREYEAFSLETKSCTVPGHEKTGWMEYGQADYLLYAFQRPDFDLNVWLINFPKLKDWFWKNEPHFPSFKMKSQNCTAGRVVPISAVSANVPARFYHVRGH